MCQSFSSSSLYSTFSKLLKGSRLAHPPGPPLQGYAAAVQANLPPVNAPIANAPPQRDVEHMEIDRATAIARQAFDRSGVQNLPPAQVQILIDHLTAMQISRGMTPHTPPAQVVGPNGEGSSSHMPPAHDVLNALIATIRDFTSTMHTTLQQVTTVATNVAASAAAIQDATQHEPVRDGNRDAREHNGGKSTVQKPPFLSMEFEEARNGRTLADIRNQWLFAYKIWANITRLDSNAWVESASQYLRGRAQEGYIKQFEQNGGAHLDWLDFVAFLDTLAAGTAMLGLDTISAIQKFDMAEYCGSTTPIKHLANGTADLETLMNKSPMYAHDLSKISALFASLPATFRDRLRFDHSPDNPTKEWNDYQKFKAHVLTYNAPFAEYVRTSASPSLKRKADLHAIDAIDVQPQGNPAVATQPPPKKPMGGSRFWDPAVMVPQNERRATSNGLDVDTYWVKDLDKSTYDNLKTQRKCLLCRRENHMLDGCRDRARRFADGSFFYYKKSLKPAR